MQFKYIIVFVFASLSLQVMAMSLSERAMDPLHVKSMRSRARHAHLASLSKLSLKANHLTNPAVKIAYTGAVEVFDEENDPPVYLPYDFLPTATAAVYPGLPFTPADTSTRQLPMSIEEYLEAEARATTVFGSLQLFAHHLQHKFSSWTGGKAILTGGAKQAGGKNHSQMELKRAMDHEPIPSAFSTHLQQLAKRILFTAQAASTT